MPTRSSSSRRAAPGAARVERGVRLEVFLDLQADRQHRIERRHRLLEDHRDLAAAHLAQVRGRAARGCRGRCQRTAPSTWPGAWTRPHDRAQRDALARAGFADEAQNLARHDVETDVVDGGHPSRRRLEARRQVARPTAPASASGLAKRAHFLVLSSSASPSPSRRKPRPVTTMAMPGKTAIHQAVVMKFLPSAICTPHSAAGGCAPRPR